MKTAHVRIAWTKSPSLNVKSVKVDLDVGGSLTSVTFGPEVENHVINVPPLTNVKVKFTVTDDIGQTAETFYSFNTTSLEKPLPVANVTHEVIGITEDEPTEPVV